MLKTILIALGLVAGCAMPFATAPAFASDSVSVDLEYGTSEGGDSEAALYVAAEYSHSPATPDVGNSSGAASTAGERSCHLGGDVIPCTSDLGVWSSEQQCYVQRVSPQPAADDPIWGRRDQGSIYQCSPPGASFSAGTGVGFWFWAPSPGSAGAPVLVDPVTVAETAVEQMALTAPEIGMTPMRPGAPLLVGMDAWLWVDNADEHGFGPITRTATAGPTSVTATGKVTKVVWDLGDGTRVTCSGAGTKWSPDQGTGPSPTCGHRYLSPSTDETDGTYTVSATAYWQVDWAGAGQAGQLQFTMTGGRQQSVTEVQVLQVA